MYGVDVSPALVSKVTDGILEELTDWQNRPLDGCYPLLYIDAMVVKVRTNGTVINRPAYEWLVWTWTGVNMCWGYGSAKAAKAPNTGCRY